MGERGVSVQEAAPPETTVETFFTVDIRVGRIVAAEPLPKARKPAYRLEVDFGPLGTRRSSAQVTALYSPDDLIGRQVLAVVNFPPRRIAGFESQVLVLGVPDVDGNVILLSTEREAPLGGRVH
ncbi:MAG: tRNA-binding protein [Chloroflexi bacterium]|nr:tRNA-binding protein [Chloroflexota bacterium]